MIKAFGFVTLSEQAADVLADVHTMLNDLENGEDTDLYLGPTLGLQEDPFTRLQCLKDRMKLLTLV